MTLNILSFVNCLFFIYIAVLPFANTVALRNLLLLFVSIILISIFIGKSGRRIILFINVLPYPFVLWILFLIFFSVWTTNFYFATIELILQWIPVILSWLSGMAIIFVGGRFKSSFEPLIFASISIIIFYFLQLFFVIVGFYGFDASNVITIDSFFNAVLKLFSQNFSFNWMSPPFPFYGYDEMHGNLGYTGAQTIALASCWYFAATNKKNIKSWIVFFIIIICLVSAVMTSSRGALFFDLIILTTLFLLKNKFKTKDGIKNSHSNHSSKNSWLRLSLLLCLLIALIGAGKTIFKDERWIMMGIKMQAGWMVDDPINFICNGLDEVERQRILQGLEVKSPEIAEKIVAGFNQDAGRLLLVRVGWQLIKENTFGIDGSRQSYEKAIAVKCGDQPFYKFAHTHSGWMNLTLSFGWLGAGIYFLLLAYMTQQGLKYRLTSNWSFALFLVAFFWIIRGMTDACFQDHYLQMQGAVLGYLYMNTRLEAKKSQFPYNNPDTTVVTRC